MTRIFLAMFGAAILLAACESNPLAPSEIVGDRWHLVSLLETGTQPTTIDDPSKYTLEFDGGGRISLKSDCNSCGAQYSLSGSSIEFSPITCTKVFCGDTSRDGTFTRALEKARRISIDDDELSLIGDGVRLTFVRRD